MEEFNKVSADDVSVYLCPDCGAGMKFDIDKQMFLCEYCGRKELSKEESTNGNEYDLYDFINAERCRSWESEAKVLECTGCGAEIIINNEETTKFCSFCGSSYITKGYEEAVIRPDGILPFKINDVKAKEILEKWIKTRKLAPNDLRKLYGSEKLKAIYVPYWNFTTDAHAVYQIEVGKKVYKDVMENGKTIKKTVIVWEKMSGSIDRSFENIQINASRNFDEDIINKVEPFSIDKLVIYDKKYLSGYIAERYTKNLKTSFEIAKKEMRAELGGSARCEVGPGYEEVKLKKLKVKYRNSKFKHILVPIWTANYDYKGKKYNYIINGETGKMDGEMPYSGIKITIVVVGILILVGIVMYILFRLMP